jgi:melibiose permease/lactose/raffinose/galactose permease
MMEVFMKDPLVTRNRYSFALGTIGRDMLYTLVSTYLNFYLTDALDLPDSTLWGTMIIMLVIRIYDSFNDPFMGILVDNTKTRFGKFKPWIAFGAIGSAILTILFYTDLGLKGAAFLVAFTIVYLLWEMAFTANDIAYWSMLPSLSIDQKVREKIGATARVCASIGMFLVVVGVIPITKIIGDYFGKLSTGYTVVAIIIAVLMILGQCITLFGVKENRTLFKTEESTTLREMLHAIVKNDQLLFTAISMALFMIGYCTTTGFGTYFFKYAFKDENMYSVFGLILGVTQVIGFSLFPVFRRRFTRRQLYIGATVLVVAGYVVFFLSPMNIIFIAIAGIFLFAGQSFIQILMLVFLMDTIEYGQWKLKKRNESITFSIQPFINKIGAAIGTAIVNTTVILSGISSAKSPSDVSDQGIFMMKFSMLVFPLIMIVSGFLVYRIKFKIDEKMYNKIISELQDRGDVFECV